MEISLLTALSCAVFAYLGAQGVPWFLGAQTGSFYYLSRPLIAGAVVGFIMGDLSTGIQIGVAIQAVFLASLGVGGTLSADLPYSSYVVIPIAIANGFDVGVATSLAATVGILGIFAHNMMNTINVFWYNQSIAELQKGSIGKFFRNAFLYSQVTTAFLRIFPAFLAIYYGGPFINSFIHSLDERLLHGLNVLGGILPALGIALLMQYVLKERMSILFFLLGFFLISTLEINMLTLTVIGSVLAYMHYVYTAVPGETQAIKDEDVKL